LKNIEFGPVNFDCWNEYFEWKIICDYIFDNKSIKSKIKYLM